MAGADENFTYCPSITEDGAGALWMACGNDGILKYDGEHVTRYSVGEGAHALSLYHDRRGKLWVGTVEQGVHTFEAGSFEPFKP